MLGTGYKAGLRERSLKLQTCTSKPPSLSLRATTSTWLLPRNTRKLWGPRRETFTVYLRPAMAAFGFDIKCRKKSSSPYDLW